MKSLNAALVTSEPGGRDFHREFARPERVLQFGEGNFLRAFVDPMIDRMNAMGLFNGRVVLVQPIMQGLTRVVNQQDGLYTLLLRGILDGKVVEEQSVIASVSRGIDPYTAFGEFLACAHNPDLRFLVSNTTEAGIAYRAEDAFDDAPQTSFPGKLTRFLWERYTAFHGDPAKGFILLPCELIDRNGDNLKRTVLHTATNWKLELAFLTWLVEANTFTNTLVDRIVTGYPRDEAAELCARLGYQDQLLDVGEPFHFWAIEAPAFVAKELPLVEAGFHVAWTDNLQPWRDRKVRILNGAHTSMSLAAYLEGKRTVGECMADPAVTAFLERAIADEIIPGLTLDRAQLDHFAAAVIERFRNPFLKHQLLSIALNSVSKYRARVLPSVERFIELNGRPPVRLSFALAALIVFYNGKQPAKDDAPVMEEFAALWSRFGQDPGVLTSAVLGKAEWWGRDLRELPGFADAVAGSVRQILDHGIVWP